LIDTVYLSCSAWPDGSVYSKNPFIDYRVLISMAANILNVTLNGTLNS